LIEAKRASLVYQDHGREVFACRDVDLQLEDDKFFGVLGPSGSGKSSLLYLLSGLKMPTSGEVAYRGEPYAHMAERSRGELRLSKFGFVFQHPFLIGYLTALENVLLVGSNDGEERAKDLFSRMGLAEKAHRMPAELSGGEKQRVCVARALLSEPEIIFADEPTASLDHASGETVIDLLNTFRKGALVVVSHDLSMLRHADKIYRMEDGRLAQVNQKRSSSGRSSISDVH
jgi:putative ABC transport system ATP-binding protein